MGQTGNYGNMPELKIGTVILVSGDFKYLEGVLAVYYRINRIYCLGGYIAKK